MSGLCGWIGWDGPAEAAASMAAPLSAFDGSALATRSEGRCALAGGPGEVHADGGLLAFVAGRPYWSDPALEARAASAGAAAALHDGYRRKGPAVLESMHGAFAVACLDSAKEAGLLAVDRHGICPLFFRHEDGTLLFASTGAALDAHPRGARELDPQGIYDYVYFGFVPAPGSVRRGRRRLLPGERLRFASGRAVRETYWSVSYRPARASRDELREELFALLRESVRRSGGGPRRGAFLSGGLDSSTVAGLLAEIESGAPTFSIGFDVDRYDEMSYARLAAQRFGNEPHEYNVTPADVESLVPRLAAICPEPFGNESAVPAYYCARLAREHGVGRMLAGDGGDEIFGGNSRYALQQVFDLYRRVPRVLRRILEPVLFRFPFGDRIWPVRKGRGYVRQATVPMPARLETYNHVERLGAETIFEPELLAAVDRGHPLALLRESYDGADASTMLNRILDLDRKFTLADNDLPKVSRACELAGVEVDYPLLSDELVEFAARVPPALKATRTQLRPFYKWAMKGFLPDETLRKKKHGFGLPFGVWLTTHEPLQELVRDSLGGLRRRGFIRPDFLDRLLEAHQSEHAIYYGVAVWHLMMLEQWLRVHVDGGVRSPV